MLKKISFILFFLLICFWAVAAQTPELEITLSVGPGEYFSTGIYIPAKNIYLFYGDTPLSCEPGEVLEIRYLPLPVPSPPPCGSIAIPDFNGWAVSPDPAYSPDLTGEVLYLTMDQSYTVTPVISARIIDGPDCNGIILSASATNVEPGQEFTTSLEIRLEKAQLVAYSFTVIYDSELIALDRSKGVDGVSLGVDGFLSSGNSINPGEVQVAGFEASGKGPGILDFLTFHWVAGPSTGTSSINLLIDSATDINYNAIEFTRFLSNYSVDITIPGGILYGDANSDQTVNIVDALKVACYTVNNNEPGIDLLASDVNLDNQVTIVDALIIAQYSVNLISSLPQ